MFLYRVVHSLDRHRVPYALVGGYAVALHGAVRGTVDIDIVLALRKEVFLAAEKALMSLGLKPRLPVSGAEVFDFRAEYIKNRNLIAWHFGNPDEPIEQVDVIITHDRAKMRVKRIISQGVTLQVASVEDLIAMKSAAGRPQDLEDIKALRRLQ